MHDYRSVPEFRARAVRLWLLAAAAMIFLTLIIGGATRLTVSGLSIVAERYVITPGAVLALVAGTFLVHKTGHDFGEFWIVAAYILWIVAITIGWVVLGRHSSRLNGHAKELLAKGVEEDDALAKEAAAPVGPVFGAVQNVILLAFIYLMVVRPGAKF